MRWISPLVLGATLLVSPLSAQTGLSATPAFQVRADPQASPASPRLYFAAGPDQPAGSRVLTFEVRLNGKVYLQETIFLETAAAEGNAFELLATRPDLRARLADLAARRTKQLEVRVSVDQKTIRSFLTYRQFLLYSQALAEAGVEPRKAISLVLDPARRGGGNRNPATKGMQIDPVCADQCQADYQTCVDNGGCDYGDCSRCQSPYDSCIYYCPLVCYEPRSVSSSDSVQNWNGWTNTGNVGCYKSSPSNFYGVYFVEVAMQRKHTTTTTTTHCDGTTSTSSSVWYDYWYCWNNSGVSCSFQNLWSLACHY
jgi:hypothetical protein